MMSNFVDPNPITVLENAKTFVLVSFQPYNKDKGKVLIANHRKSLLGTRYLLDSKIWNKNFDWPLICLVKKKLVFTAARKKKQKYEITENQAVTQFCKRMRGQQELSCCAKRSFASFRVSATEFSAEFSVTHSQVNSPWNQLTLKSTRVVNILSSRDNIEI